MLTAICTLFEGDYHYGLGALINSLFKHGFRGIIWAGYRGDLPPWARPIKLAASFQEYEAAEGCSIRFIPLSTDYHLTNYKPFFMLRVWRDFCSECEAIFYFDPDIIIKCEWPFFEEWVTHGIALCEDVNSPLYSTHPLRMAWRRFFKPHGFTVTSESNIYFNAGFVGVTRRMQRFLQDWQVILDLISGEVGGLRNLKNGWLSDRTLKFCIPDQDALNISVMYSTDPISSIGKEGMDFKFGGYTMSHAIGPLKPWRKSMIREALRGKPPRLADKNYWRYTEEPIQLYSRTKLFWKCLELKFAAGIGRYLS